MTSKVYTTIKFEWERTDLNDDESNGDLHTLPGSQTVLDQRDREFIDDANEPERR